MSDLTNVVHDISETRAAAAVQAAYDDEAASCREARMLRGLSERCKRGAVQAQAVKTGTPKSWRLCYNGTLGGEVVVSLAGVLIHNDLHKRMKDIPSRPKALKYLSRGVGICGYGNYDFGQITTDISYVHEVFARELGRVEDPEFASMKGFLVLNASNRYFTEKKFAPHITYSPYSEDEDPYGAVHKSVVEHERKLEVVAIEENEIKYYEKISLMTDGKMTTQMKECSSAIFRNGDVVQIQVSFLAFPKQGGNGGGAMRSFVVRPILRSVALINTSVRKEAEARMFIQPTTYLAPPLRLLKRHIGYDVEETELPNKMRRMTLTDNVESD